MIKRTFILSVMVCALSLLTALDSIAEEPQIPMQGPIRMQRQRQVQESNQIQGRVRRNTQKKIYIYGSQLMTEQERMEYREKMLRLKTAREREAYRLEHHKKMQIRAREKGVKLPDEIPTGVGGGRGPGGNGGLGGLGSGGMGLGGGGMGLGSGRRGR